MTDKELRELFPDYEMLEPMTKEQLMDLKKKINELSDEDKKQRDLYLRGLATGEIQGPPVGFASIDKPWLKYYSEEQIIEDAPKISCYENLVNSNVEHLSDVAIDYFGNKITYKELFENIDKTASAFISMGVKKGDVVTICSITTPEIIYSFYALNKIGAISNMVDVRYTKLAIKNFLNEVESKYMIMLDLCYPRVDEIRDETKLEKVISVSPLNSVPFALKKMAQTMNFFKGKRNKIEYIDPYVDWNDFISNHKSIEIEQHCYTENYPVAVVHTGGTTGVPKGVVLTNENFNNAVVQIKNSNVNADRGYRFLNIMPPFIAYGIVLGLNVPITLGWRTTVVPQFDANKFDELLIKHKPNGIMGVPAYWETVMNSEKVKKKGLPYVKDILLGGDKIKPEFELRLNKYLKDNGCDACVEKGYSMTEASACATFSSRKANELDSAGIPLVKTSVSVFEPGTINELRPGEIGEICIKTPTMMLEYFDKEDDTKKVKIVHDDGEWIHSGDLGYVDENGFVYPKDRIKRMIIRSGFKVFPSEIENLFLSCDAVETCAVIGVPDSVDVTAPEVHVVLKDKYRFDEDNIKTELIKLFKNSSLPPYFEPVGYVFRDTMPLTNVGKIDFVSLQNEREKIYKAKVKVKK